MDMSPEEGSRENCVHLIYEPVEFCLCREHACISLENWIRKLFSFRVGKFAEGGLDFDLN